MVRRECKVFGSSGVGGIFLDSSLVFPPCGGFFLHRLVNLKILVKISELQICKCSTEQHVPAQTCKFKQNWQSCEFVMASGQGNLHPRLDVVAVGQKRASCYARFLNPPIVSIHPWCISCAFGNAATAGWYIIQ